MVNELWPRDDDGEIMFPGKSKLVNISCHLRALAVNNHTENRIAYLGFERLEELLDDAITTIEGAFEHVEVVRRKKVK